MKSKNLVTMAASVLVLALAGCETISEDACLAGNWQDIGFSDGESGKSRSRLADISETCMKYGATVDRDSYLLGFEQGTARYCSADRGYRTGRSGDQPHGECEAGVYSNYLDAYADGFEEYRLISERDVMVQEWEAAYADLVETMQRLEFGDANSIQRRVMDDDAEKLVAYMTEQLDAIRSFEVAYGLQEWVVPTETGFRDPRSGANRFRMMGERDRMTQDWRATQRELESLTSRLEDDGLPELERERLSREYEDVSELSMTQLVDIRIFERIHGLTAWRMPDR